MTKLPRRHFQLVFSLIMGAMMVFIMTFVITVANVGMPPDFLARWARAFAIAYVVAVPAIYVVAPRARQLAGRLADDPLASLAASAPTVSDTTRTPR